MPMAVDAQATEITTISHCFFTVLLLGRKGTANARFHQQQININKDF